MFRELGMTLVVFATLVLWNSGCSQSDEELQPPLSSQPAPPATRPGAPGPGAPGPGVPGPGAPGPRAPNPLHVEYQEIQRHGQAQQKAMADSQVAQQYSELETYLEAEMRSADPEFESKRERLQALQGELAAAQQASDQEEFQAIAQKGNALQAEMQRTQGETMQKENVVARVEAFRAILTKRMEEIDPETPKLIERSIAIAAELQGS